jgi:hypothetical protein
VRLKNTLLNNVLGKQLGIVSPDGDIFPVAAQANPVKETFPNHYPIDSIKYLMFWHVYCIIARDLFGILLNT